MSDCLVIVICKIIFVIFISDMSSKVDKTDEGLNVLRTGQDILTSHVKTMENELTSVRTQQKDLSDKVDRNLTELRNHQLDNSNAPLTPGGISVFRFGFLCTPRIFSEIKSQQLFDRAETFRYGFDFVHLLFVGFMFD